jgi:beta-barrel assembly-enhancing protease
MSIPAVFFDGQSARDHEVTVKLENRELVISGATIVTKHWPLFRMHPIDPPTPGTPFRLSHDAYPGERLIVRDENFIAELVREVPRLKGGYTARHFGQVFGWTAGGIGALVAVGFVFLSLLPQYLAPFLPEKWRTDTGKQLEKSVIAGVGECTDPDGVRALGAMIGNLSNGNDLPPLTVKVYDLGLVNAFAVSGGRVIMTRGLIDAAENPDEVAGVLAHEIGHVFHYHPEEQLVRLTGIQVLASIFSGGGSSDLVTNAAALATILRYSRDAEEEADTYARTSLVNAKINPLGFKTFFEKISKLEGKKPTADESRSALDQLGNVFSTHPDTSERIKKIEPLPADTKAIPSLNEQEWKALQKVCSKITKSE